MADLDSSKSLSALLNGIVQRTYFSNTEISEELLNRELYPQLSPHEFRVLLDKMRGVLKSIVSADMDLNQLEAFLTAQTKKQGGITEDNARVIAKFWKNHKINIRDSLITRSKWDNSLKAINWRVDLKSQSRHIDHGNTPVAIAEIQLGKNGQESEFLCLEFDETKINYILKKLSEAEESITALIHTS
ncbi:COMM domain-containing protein 1 [Microcaecilia unicolor]|uniref:COMM domain-containing protein 1 n=1 Tax=Microcaecilia unicolor TaxID=1415580 RepID=A0A6P7XN08_9AMPH|nr:COMM domain-containing protein 1 [Microcaecilia unicolor]